MTVHDHEESRLPPIYPGTTVSIPPSSEENANPAVTIPGDGIYQVGVDIQPGTYRSEGGDDCSWERLRGRSGSPADVIANGAGTGPQVVQILPTDAGFKTQRCPTWARQSATTPTTTTGATTSTSTSTTKKPVRLPEGARECPPEGGPAGGFTQTAVGTSSTSCPFAEQVRLAYGANRPPSSGPRQIDARSPVTGETYTMTCTTTGSYVVCTGGDGAVVYVY